MAETSWDKLLNPKGESEELSEGGETVAAVQDLVNDLGGKAVGATVGAYTKNAAAGTAANEATYGILDTITGPIIKAIDRASNARKRVTAEAAKHTLADVLTEAGWDEAEINALPKGGIAISSSLIGQVAARMQAEGRGQDEISYITRELYNLKDEP